MEDVLEVYHRPYNADRPLVCFDETSKQLLKHTRVSIPVRPGRPALVDDEYKRCGTANIFAAIEPITGWSLVEATEHRTSIDTAHFLRRLANAFPNTSAIVLVMDNLSTHRLACFYEAFEPSEARSLSQRFEIHYTPTHGSWLNVAEIFLSAMSRQCLDRRIDNMAHLQTHLDAWRLSRENASVNWRFTTAQARIKLRSLYPSIQ